MFPVNFGCSYTPTIRHPADVCVCICGCVRACCYYNLCAWCPVPVQWHWHHQVILTCQLSTNSWYEYSWETFRNTRSLNFPRTCWLDMQCISTLTFHCHQLFSVCVCSVSACYMHVQQTGTRKTVSSSYCVCVCEQSLTDVFLLHIPPNITNVIYNSFQHPHNPLGVLQCIRAKTLLAVI